MATPTRIRRKRFRSAAAAAVLMVAILTAIAAGAVASDVDVAVVDVTVPTTGVTLAPGQSGSIKINMSVTGNQVGTATFEVYRDWTLSGGVFTGSNPQEFTVPARAPTDAATLFSTTGTVSVAAGQATGAFTLAAGAFDITNTNTTGAKLSAGDSSNYSVTVTNPPPPSDTTPPVISHALNPPAPNGANGWYNTDVTLTWTVTENESSSSLVKTGCVDQSITTDQAATTYSCSATSQGGAAGPENVTIKRDATPPSVTWNGGPGDGGNYYFGSVPTAGTCTASDALSGPNNCNVGGYSAAVGSHTLTATAHDNAGNETQEQRSYSVLAWTLLGFYQPTDMGGVLNTVKGGSTVPLKFEAFAGPTELADTAAVKSLAAKQVTCDTAAPTDDVEVTATGGTALRYDATGGQFIYNWQTPKQAGNCYVVTMTTQDGSTLVAKFKTK